MRQRWPAHPFIFASMPILALMASNLGVVPPIQVVRPLTLALLSAFLLLLLFRSLLHDRAKAGVLASTCVILFFSYGHTHTVSLAVLSVLLQAVFDIRAGSSLAAWLHPFLTSMFAGVFLLILRAVRRRIRRPGGITQLLNLVATFTLLYPVVQILRSEFSLREYQAAPSLSEILQSRMDEGETSPDVYYIILDGYAAERTLQEVYGYENQDFLHFLSAQGFYVASESRSNYAQTILSLASSLNFDYLDKILGGARANDVNALIPLLRNNQVRRRVADEGYQFIAFSTGYLRTEVPDADLFLQPGVESAGNLESLMIETTFLRAVESLAGAVGLRFPYPGYEPHRQRVLFTLEQLPRIAEIPGPKFVFAHLLIPHPPFVFGADGEEVPQTRRYQLEDGSDFQGTREEYIEGYRNQVAYVNSRLAEIIPEILAASSPDPIIVIQGDHGPGAGLNWDSPSAEGLSERFQILNAIRLPGPEPGLLYPDMSPVNTFRMILNRYFGTTLALLPDRSYFSSPAKPLELQPVQP